MELQFKFTHQDLNLNHSILVSEDFTTTDVHAFWAIIRDLNTSMAKVVEILNAYENGEPLTADDFSDITCDVCKRTFASPSNLKQHKTVMGHNGQ